MNRLALLACIALAGCPKGSAPPEPAPSPVPKQQVVESTPTIPPAPVAAPAGPDPVLPPAEPKFKQFDYKGQVPGQFTVDEFRELHPNARGDKAAPRGIERWELARDAKLTIANVPVETAAYSFIDGKLLEISLLVYSSPLQVLGALREKYGPPSTEDENGEYWHAKDGTLRVVKGVSGIAVRFDNAAMVQEAEKRADAATLEEVRSNAKDL